MGGAEARIITDVTGEYFKMGNGVKQGDPLSPLLFNCTLEEIFRNIDWAEKGINFFVYTFLKYSSIPKM